jgi:hypothetical protein
LSNHYSLNDYATQENEKAKAKSNLFGSRHLSSGPTVYYKGIALKEQDKTSIVAKTSFKITAQIQTVLFSKNLMFLQMNTDLSPRILLPKKNGLTGSFRS